MLSVAFSPGDGRLLAIGKRGIAVCDPATGKEVHAFKSTNAPSLAFSPDGLHLVSAGASDPTVSVRDVAGEKPPLRLKGHASPSTGVAFSPDGKLIASTSHDQTLKIWDAATGAELRTLRGHAGYVMKVAFSPDGRYLASGSWDSTVKVWDVATWAEICTLRGHAGYVWAVAFSPDGRRLASASGYAGNGEIKVWDATLWKNKAGGER